MRARRFYEKHSYVRHGPIRVLHDISNSLEFAYAKPVAGIESLDAPPPLRQSSAWPRSSARASMRGHRTGLPPLAPDVARGF